MTSAVDVGGLERLMAALQEIVQETSHFLPNIGEDLPQDSIAAQELANFPRQDLVLTAYSQGDMLLEVASEQMTCFIRTCTEPALPIAAWSTVRAVIESCALASWLLDPKIDVKTRVQRSFAFRFEGLVQQLRAAQATDHRKHVAASSERINEVERIALAAGFDKVTDRNGRRTGIGQVMPTVTSIVRDTLDEEVTYRLLSAVTHAHHWALQQISFQLLPREFAAPDSSPRTRPGLRSLKKVAKPICFQHLSRQVMKAFTTPALYKTKLFGGDYDRFAAEIKLYERRITELAKAMEFVPGEQETD